MLHLFKIQPALDLDALNWYICLEIQKIQISGPLYRKEKYISLLHTIFLVGIHEAILNSSHLSFCWT